MFKILALTIMPTITTSMATSSANASQLKAAPKPTKVNVRAKPPVAAVKPGVRRSARVKRMRLNRSRFVIGGRECVCGRCKALWRRVQGRMYTPRILFRHTCGWKPSMRPRPIRGIRRGHFIRRPIGIRRVAPRGRTVRP